jgi:hypothetical protein
MRQEIWIRVQAPIDGGTAEAQRRVSQIKKMLERLALELLEVRQVQVTKVVDEEF